MPTRYRVHDVSTWELVDAETVGREEKYWIRSPDAGHSESRENDWLFKPARITVSGHRQGEDWSEKLAREFGRRLGVPCAEVELAVRDGVDGSISRNVTPDGWNLVHGAILLGRLLDDYVEGARNPPGRPGHSLSNIISALRECEPPPECANLDAPTVFAGYAVLDALIGNQDRHDQNWAVLRHTTGTGTPLRLAASYDHASGLGFQRLDSFRSEKLRSRTVEAFAVRAVAQRYEHDAGAGRAAIPNLVQAADQALGLAGADARRYWMRRLEAVDDSELAEIVAGAPDLSGVTRTFVVELVRINRRRLLRAC